MEIELPSAVLESILASGDIAEADIARLRRAIFADGLVARVELKALFDFEKSRHVHNGAWSQLFVDTVVQHVIEDVQPVGYLSDDNAHWVIEQIGTKQGARSDTALEALIRIVETAREVPPFFSAYVLRQLKEAVVYSDGVDLRGRNLTPGCVNAAELDMIRRVLWGAGAEGQLAISKEEAEALFEIADAATGNISDPGWDDLFARAIGNYLIGATGRAVPTRAESLAMWHTDYQVDMCEVFSKALNSPLEWRKTGFFGRLVKEGALSAQIEARIGRDNDERDQTIDTARTLIGPKADWLVDRIRRNGVTSGPEAALLEFLKCEVLRLSGEMVAMLPGPQFAKRA